MNIADYNARFGAPGRIVFHEGFAGYPNVVLANKYGTAEVSLLGANVLSYRATGHSETLFRPAKRDYNRGDKFHGGIPVCWPQFGNRMDKSLPPHGFAAKMIFEVRGTEYSEEQTEIRLGLKSDAATKSIWPHEFDFEVKISVSMKLNLSMTTKNTDETPFTFNCGFHPYFSVRDREGMVVKGMNGLHYVDGTKADLPEGEWEGDVKGDFSPDHIFALPPAPRHEAAIIDNGLRRAHAIAATGNNRFVVWNCGTENEAEIADFRTGDWKKYICVEPVSDWPGGRELKPGEKYTLTAAIQTTLEGVAQ